MKINFHKGNGLVPAIIQHAHSGQVLMLGYMNAAALEKTRADGRVTFYSRSRQCLWTKGETSGNFLKVVDIRPDCDADTLLIRAEPAGPVCHTGAETCFGTAPTAAYSFLKQLEAVIEDRRDHPHPDSYTQQLFEEGVRKIAQKVGEEATEVVIDALSGDDAALKGETADLLYHLMVLLAARGLRLADVVAVLASRHT